MRGVNATVGWSVRETEPGCGLAPGRGAFAVSTKPKAERITLGADDMWNWNQSAAVPLPVRPSPSPRQLLLLDVPTVTASATTHSPVAKLPCPCRLCL